MSNILYQIIEENLTENEGLFTIRLNPDNEIFAGHFPGQPVLPGVLQLRTVVELCRRMTGKALNLHQVLLCKYLVFIDPGKSNQLEVSIKVSPGEADYQVQAQIKDAQSVYSKMNLRLTEF